MRRTDVPFTFMCWFYPGGLLGGGARSLCFLDDLAFAWGHGKSGATTQRYLQHLCIKETSAQICSNHPPVTFRSSSDDLCCSPEVRSHPPCAWASRPASRVPRLKMPQKSGTSRASATLVASALGRPRSREDRMPVSPGAAHATCVTPSLAEIRISGCPRCRCADGAELGSYPESWAGRWCRRESRR